VAFPFFERNGAHICPRGWLWPQEWRGCTSLHRGFIGHEHSPSQAWPHAHALAGCRWEPAGHPPFLHGRGARPQGWPHCCVGAEPPLHCFCGLAPHLGQVPAGLSPWAHQARCGARLGPCQRRPITGGRRRPAISGSEDAPRVSCLFTPRVKWEESSQECGLRTASPASKSRHGCSLLVQQARCHAQRGVCAHTRRARRRGDVIFLRCSCPVTGCGGCSSSQTRCVCDTAQPLGRPAGKEQSKCITASSRPALQGPPSFSFLPGRSFLRGRARHSC